MNPPALALALALARPSPVRRAGQSPAARCPHRRASRGKSRSPHRPRRQPRGPQPACRPPAARPACLAARAPRAGSPAQRPTSRPPSPPSPPPPLRRRPGPMAARAPLACPRRGGTQPAAPRSSRLARPGVRCRVRPPRGPRAPAASAAALRAPAVRPAPRAVSPAPRTVRRTGVAAAASARACLSCERSPSPHPKAALRGERAPGRGGASRAPASGRKSAPPRRVQLVRKDGRDVSS